MWCNYLRATVSSMNRYLSLVFWSAILTGFLAINVQGQGGSKHPTPEYMNEVYFYPGEGQALVLLEKGEAKVKTKTLAKIISYLVRTIDLTHFLCLAKNFSTKMTQIKKGTQ